MNETEFSDQLDVLFELYPTRTVLIDFIGTTMEEIRSLWGKGELMIMMEHFASNIVISKLKNMLVEQNTIHPHGPRFMVACAEHEQHEIGALMIAILLAVNGWKVVYLGQNTPTSNVLEAIDTMDFHTIAVSASHERNLQELITIGNHLQSKPTPRPNFLVGGMLFSQAKDVIDGIPCATTKSFNELIEMRPDDHPGMQDLLVKQSVEKTYALLRDAATRLKTSSTALQRKKPYAV